MAGQVRRMARRRRATRPGCPEATATICDRSRLLEGVEAVLAEIEAVLA